MWSVGFHANWFVQLKDQSKLFYRIWTSTEWFKIYKITTKLTQNPRCCSLDRWKAFVFYIDLFFTCINIPHTDFYDQFLWMLLTILKSIKSSWYSPYFTYFSFVPWHTILKYMKQFLFCFVMSGGGRWNRTNILNL